MTKSRAMTTLEQLDVRLHEHVRDVVNLRTALDIQMNRISHIYAEPGVQPHARLRRQSLRVVPIRQSRPPHSSWISSITRSAVAPARKLKTRGMGAVPN
jgi:hypothetical protein